MNNLHRPQRSERKDPFPQIPFALEDTHVPGDTWVGYAVAFAVVVLVVLSLWGM